jgi:hypothetical protein
MATTKKAAATAEKETKKTTKTATKTATKAAKTTKAAEEVKAEAKAEVKAEKKAPAKQAAPKKAAPKKAAPAKPAEAKVDFFVEYGGVQVSVADVIANVKATYGKDAKEISVYLKPEESKAYFVADGEEKEMDVFFC